MRSVDTAGARKNAPVAGGNGNSEQGKLSAEKVRNWTPRVSSRLLESLATRVDAQGPRDPISVETPFSAETLGTVPACTVQDVAAAVANAREAQRAWAATPVRRRARLLLGFHDLVIAKGNEVLDLIQLECGKSRRHAYLEVLATALAARYYSFTAGLTLRPRARWGALPILTTAREYHRPRGVIGFICPWNFPLILGINDALAALMAGNAVVIKPDSQTPFTLLWAVRLLEEAGLPTALVQVVTGSGRELGPAIVDGVDYLMFTGSTATGRLLAQQAAGRLIECSMELGGKNPALVLDDAPFARDLAGLHLGVDAVDGLADGIANAAGQVCVSIERLYVQDGIYDRFVPRLAQALAELRLGASFDYSVDVGSLASAEQLAKVSSLVDEAVSKGARVLAGGHARPDLGPYFYEPTLLEDATEEMRLYRDEVFGPVCYVERFRDADEALERMNDTQYGLLASIWSEDVGRARRLAARLQSGQVCINDCFQAGWASAAAMGGFKQSGIGRRHGPSGLLKYTELQTVVVQRLLPVTQLPFGGGERYQQIMGRAAKLLRRSGIP